MGSQITIDDLRKIEAGIREKYINVVNRVAEKVERSVLVIPGLAESEKNSIRQLTRFDVLVGPVSGFLTPLFLLQNDF